MLLNYLKITLAVLQRRKFFTFISLFGISLTLTILVVATAFIDTTGHCLFIAFPILDIASGFEGMVEECAGVLGTDWTTEDVNRIGAEILKTERRFNEAAGFTQADDRLPEFMKYEPLPPLNVVNDIPDEALDAVYAEL